MKTTTKKHIVALIGILSLSSVGWSVEPMSDEDMGDFALASGQSFLQVYGPSSAGLSIDTPNGSGDVDDTSLTSSSKVIEDLDQDSLEIKTVELNPNVPDEETIDDVIEAGIITVGNAQVEDTTSQISYRNADFNREAIFNKDGSVIQTRDLQIDRLEFQNITIDDNPSLGNVYISDWSSQGRTTTQGR